jgi:hypothetical protein
MASIIKTSIDLTKIDKTKIIDGKKGKYLPITITINDEVDQFGNQGPVIISQSKEERDAQEDKVYLGNVVAAAPRNGAPSAPAKPAAVEEDLPF